MSLAETFRQDTQLWGAASPETTLTFPSVGILPEVGTTLQLP